MNELFLKKKKRKKKQIIKITGVSLSSVSIGLNVQFLLKNWVDESIRMQLDQIDDPSKTWNYLQTFDLKEQNCVLNNSIISNNPGNHNDERKTFQKPCDMNNQACASNFDHSPNSTKVKYILVARECLIDFSNIIQVRQHRIICRMKDVVCWHTQKSHCFS